MDINYKELETNILRDFFREVSTVEPLDNSISDSPIIKKTARKLKTALKGCKERCSCAKRRFDMCEDCMGSSGELYAYRASYRMLQKAKEYNFTEAEVKQFYNNTQKDFTPKDKRK